MADSLPSRRFVNVDVPEITNFEAEFIYNFFTKDERVNDSGLHNNNTFNRRINEIAGTQIIDTNNFKRFVPRFIKFNWNTKAGINRNSNQTTISIKNNINKIHNEQTFTSDDYTSTIFQNSNQDRKLSFLLSRALNEIQKREQQPNIQSPLDIVKFLNNQTNKNVNPRFLSNSFIQFLNEGIVFSNNNLITNNNNIIKDISNVATRIQINNKLLEKILKTAAQTTTSTFDSDLQNKINQAKEIQNRAVSQKNSSILDALDYDFEILEFLEVKSIDPTSYNPNFEIVGYIIDKEEISSDGVAHKKEPIIVENSTINETIDLKIHYGSRYMYAIRSIAVVETTVQDTDTNDTLVVTFLVSSQPSKKILIETEEFLPPPEPADFDITYDYQHNALRLMWNFPVNTQRDIKQFQVFRRRNIFEPFELIKQYNFDDSEIKSDPREFPDEDLIEYLSSPKNFYLDSEFTKDTTFIYTICSIDAHSFSSNYTTQFQVSFDKFKNKIIKETVSLSGAPKAYPNMFILNQNTFVDSIKTSNHNQVKVVFNPEFLKVTDNQNNDLRLLKTDNDSKYKLQLINIDLQEQQTIDLYLKDRRTVTEKEEND